jgi:hypothetical protein
VVHTWWLLLSVGSCSEALMGLWFYMHTIMLPSCSQGLYHAGFVPQGGACCWDVRLLLVWAGFLLSHCMGFAPC